MGLLSQSQPGVAYIHFVGVHPDRRETGLARALYERFFDEMRTKGCHRVDAVTSIHNLRSQDFHRSMGFELDGDTDFDGILGYNDYDGPEQHRVSFFRNI